MHQLKKLYKLSEKSLKALRTGKNLLAFSGGVDSSALFFILKEHDITFDMISVNYQTRDESDKEENYAKELAKKYKKKIYIKKVTIPKNNFEYNARCIRYDFFDKTIKDIGYNNLITAHQLDDKLEWFLMQLTKGAGLVELLGFEEIEKRENYTLIRPLIEYSKDELIEFLQINKLNYFIDKSNFDLKYKRNYFRKSFSSPLIKNHKNGIINSFRYLKADKDKIFNQKEIKKIEDLYIIERSFDDILEIRIIDNILKHCGYLLSKAQRDEIIQKKDVVISDRFAIVLDKNSIYISPYIKTKMDKKFKEKCRIKKIPPKIRGYLYKKNIDLFTF